MRHSALRIFSLLAPLFAATGADAALLRFDLPLATSHVLAWSDWSGPGATPTSFELSFTVDTLSFSSSNLTYIGDPTGEIQSYRFYGVDVQSVSLIANGYELWSDPAGLVMDFGGDFPGIEPEGGSCYCFLGGANLLSQSLGLSYDDDIPPRSTLGGDPLAAILLAQAPLTNVPSVSATGEWGNLLGYGPVTVSVVPLPPAVWLLGTAVTALCGRGWLRRARRIRRQPST
jgi:hypothetical protein